MTRPQTALDNPVGTSRKDGDSMSHNGSGRPRRVRHLVVGTVAAAVAGGLTLGAAPASAGTLVAGVRTAAAPHSLATAAPPSGAVTSTACTEGAGTAACDLYATAGTLALPGTTGVPVWSFTSTAGGPVTGSSAVLVVNQHDTVTVTVHNDLTAAGAVSLAVPGASALSDDAAGAAPGGSATYTFTADRAGTFLYEAGHTANGARQALMGLVGALVVRPAGFDPAAATHDDLDLTGSAAAGNAAFPNRFEDEAVMVLTEVDPLFNANPLTYDLRNVRGTYRLINGKAFPQTAGVPTAPGHRVLLRYLNAGSVSHSMGVQNLAQRVVAIDGQPSDGGALVADTLPGGQTEDVLVTEPAAGGTFAVYDASGALDTAGQKVGTTQQVAFGGMMALLGTDVVPAAAVGPRSRITSMSPNPAVSTGSVDVAASFGPGATAAEVLIDGEVTTAGVGTSAITFDLATGHAVIPAARLGLLSGGQHRVYVRAAAGTTWGAVTSAVLTVAKVGATTSGLAVSPDPSSGSSALTVTATGDASGISSTVTAAQLRIDTGPFSPMTLTSPGTAVTAETATIAQATAAGLSEGPHTVEVQTQDALTGTYGTSVSTTIGIDRHAPTVTAGTSPAITPNPSDGTVGDPADPTALKVAASFTDQSAAGLQSPVVAAEGFFPQLTAGAQLAPTSTDFGHGFVMAAADGSFGGTSESAYGLVPLTQLTAYPDGSYQMWVHAKDAAGNWGDLVPVTLTVKRGLFSDGFESGSTAAWNGGTVGPVTVTATGALAGTYSMLTTGAGTAQATVTDTSPTALTGYHARFSVSSSLVTGNNPIGIFTGLGSTTNPVFQVQLRRGTGRTATTQVRLLAWRSTGTAGTAWVTLPAGSSSLQVDWASGTRATLSLTTNGVVSSLTGQNTSTLRVETVRLGLLQQPGSSTSVTGTALFDSFRSSITPLP